MQEIQAGIKVFGRAKQVRHCFVVAVVLVRIPRSMALQLDRSLIYDLKSFLHVLARAYDMCLCDFAVHRWQDITCSGKVWRILTPLSLDVLCKS